MLAVTKHQPKNHPPAIFTHLNGNPPHYPTANSGRQQSLMSRLKDKPKPLQRILILGSSGSGKSTLARQLGATLELPVIHLDRHFWNPGWVETPAAEWREEVKSLVQRKQWIIDGNYRDTLDIRLQAAEAVIFLDFSRLTCMIGAIHRRFKYLNKPRLDIATGCKEKIFDPNFPAFLWHIWNYPHRARPHVLQSLSAVADSVAVIRLRSRRQASQFLLNPHHPSFYDTTLSKLSADSKAAPPTPTSLARTRYLDM